MPTAEQGLGPPFEAFVTTAQNGGPRTPIQGERIVVVLGRDEGGRPLEVSIYLQPWPGSPTDLVVAAFEEKTQLDAPPAHLPRLIVEPSQGPNLISLRVEYRPIGPASLIDDAG